MTDIAVDPGIITTLLNAALDYGETTRDYHEARDLWLSSYMLSEEKLLGRGSKLHAAYTRAYTYRELARDELLRTALTCTDQARADILAQLLANATTTPEGEQA